MKAIKRAFALLLTTAMCLSFTACSFLKKDASSDTDTAVESQEVIEQTKLEELVSDETFQQQVKSMSSSYKAQGIELSVTAEGNKLVYTCGYTIEVEDLATTKEKLSEYLDGAKMTSSFNSILKSVQTTVPEAEAVVVRYYDKDGNELVAKEYTGSAR